MVLAKSPLKNTSSFGDEISVSVEASFELQNKFISIDFPVFLTTMLQSENRDLVLAAVTRVGSLLALRTSNLCALTHLVLSKDETLRAAAVKHITEIASDAALHDKVLKTMQWKHLK